MNFINGNQDSNSCRILGENSMIPGQFHIRI
nr:MAG TPA: hypothetical protein [Microviridae sp.]